MKLGPFATASKPTLIAGVVGFFVMTAVIAVIGAPLRENGGAAIVAFELAGSAQNVETVLNSWSQSQKLIAAFHTGADLLYIFLYVFGLSAWASYVARQAAPLFRVLGAFLAWGMPLAGILDLVENTGLLVQLLNGGDDNWARLARHAALAKFAIAYATSGYIVIIGIWSAIRKLVRKA